MTRFCLTCLAALLVVCLGGCDRGNGLRSSDSQFLGRWTFDRQYTQAHMPKDLAKKPADWGWQDAPAGGSQTEAASIAANVNGMMNNTLKPMLTEQLLAQMDGQTFSLTPKLITSSSGKAQTYRVIERATANSWSVKTSDGEIATYTNEDGRLVIPTTGDVHFKLYFKRVSQ